MQGWLPLYLLCTTLLLGMLSACGQGSQPAESPGAIPAQVTAPARQTPLPIDFVVCIDNSRSIKEPEQHLIRETAMLLADLAAPGDQLSVITFGSTARLVTSKRITNNNDRIELKQQIHSGIDFRENFSDIRAGIRELANHQSSLFRASGQSIRAPILFSDGKLEPADRKASATQEAFDELQALLAGSLAGTDIYTVVLGDTASRDRFLRLGTQDLTGQILMRQYIARSPERYFHAKSLDALLPIVVLILNKTKGISSLGEPGKAEFRIDQTVQSMTFIIRKRSTSGGVPLGNSEDIELHRSSGDPLTLRNHQELLRGSPTSLYWSPYEYFDLVVVTAPQEGRWEIKFRNGHIPEVLSTIVTPIDLQFRARERYYLNEAATIEAWLFDTRLAEASNQPYKIQAHLAMDNSLQASSVFIPLRHDPASNAYVFDVPAEITKALDRGGQEGKVTMELLAHDDRDPWFLRRSAPFTLELAEPFIEWALLKQNMVLMPTRDLLLTFSAAMDVSKNEGEPSFEIPPRVTITVERFDKQQKTLKSYISKELESSIVDGKRLYRFVTSVRDSGLYRYRYQLAGSTTSGVLSIASPWSPLKMRYGWEYVIAGGLVLLGLVHWTANRTAKLGGQVMPVTPVRNTMALRRRVETISLNEDGIRFQLTARRFLFRKRIQLRMTQGQAVVNGQPVTAGKRMHLLPRRRHTMTFTRGNSLQGELHIQATVRTF